MPALTGRDEPWPFFHFWRHHFWPKLASSILSFCRRKQSLQRCPDLSDEICLSHRQPKLTTRDSCLWAVLYYKRFTKAWMGCQRFFLKRRENVMFSNKIDLPYCLVVFFVVCPRLRPFWSVFGELACFWCSTVKIKSTEISGVSRSVRRSRRIIPLEKLPPGLNSSTHLKQRCCSSMTIHSIH